MEKFNRLTCKYASKETLGVITWRIVAENGKIAIVTLCNFPSPGMLHLPSMMNEMDVTSLVIMTASLGWNGYCGGSDAVMLPLLRRSGLLLRIILLPKGESALAGLELGLLHP